MWQYLRKKLGIEQQSSRINNTIREIEVLKEHITQLERKKPELKREIIFKRPKNDPLIKEVQELKDRESKIYDIISDYKKIFLEFIDLVSEKLENFNDHLNRLEERFETEIDTPVLSKYQFSLQTKPVTRDVTGRPIVTTKRPTNLSSTTDQIEQGQLLWENTTDAEREIIRVLYDAGYPLSYLELAEKLNKSLSTVKNHLNNMKAKGFKFQERTGLNNAKKYLLDSRVKTFLTLRLND